VKWTSWIALAALAPLFAWIVWSSLHTGAVRCEVCMEFRGRQACRAVDADTEELAMEGARTNACALISSGVTDSMACGRSTPLRADCNPR
jgi:hypothetical protein